MSNHRDDVIADDLKTTSFRQFNAVTGGNSHAAMDSMFRNMFYNKPRKLIGISAASQETPERIEQVIQRVAVELERRRTFHYRKDLNFVIAGSYPAAVKAFEFDPNFLLPYNDIDVYYQLQRSSKHILGMDEKDDLNFVQFGNLDLHGLIDSFDINAVMVGLQVKLPWLGTPQISEWYIKPDFRDFCVSKTLKISDITALQKPAASLIRLLHKARQLQLAYELPDESTLIQTLNGQRFSSNSVSKFDALNEPLRAEVTSRFRIRSSWTKYKKIIHLFAR